MTNIHLCCSLFIKGVLQGNKSYEFNRRRKKMLTSSDTPVPLLQDRPRLQGEEDLRLHAARSRSRLHRLCHLRYPQYSTPLCVCVVVWPKHCSESACEGVQIHLKWVSLLWCQPLGVEGDRVGVCVSVWRWVYQAWLTSETRSGKHSEQVELRGSTDTSSSQSMVPSDSQGFDTDLSGVVSINRVVVVEEEQRYNEKGSGFRELIR